MHSKKKQQVEHLEMRSGEPELGSCSCCCFACSSTNLHEEVWSPMKLEERFAALAVGRWAELFRASREADVQASAQTVRRRRREFTDDLSWRAQRAVSFVQMGSCQQPGKHWRELSWLLEHWPLWQPSTNPDRRPSAPRESLGRGIEEHVPVERFELGKDLFLISLRTARRGAAAGPSGMTSNHLFPLLQRSCSQSLHSRWQWRMFRFGQVNCVEEARWWSPETC